MDGCKTPAPPLLLLLMKMMMMERLDDGLVCCHHPLAQHCQHRQHCQHSEKRPSSQRTGSSDPVPATKRASLLGATAQGPEPPCVATSDGREGQSRDHDAHERQLDGGEKDKGCRSEVLELGNLGGALGMQDAPKSQGSRPHAPGAQGQGLKGPPVGRPK